MSALPPVSPWPLPHFPALILAGKQQPRAEGPHPGASKKSHWHTSLLCGGGGNAAVVEELCFVSFKNDLKITLENVQSKTEPA